MTACLRGPCLPHYDVHWQAEKPTRSTACREFLIILCSGDPLCVCSCRVQYVLPGYPSSYNATISVESDAILLNGATFYENEPLGYLGNDLLQVSFFLGEIGFVPLRLSLD